MSLVSFIMFLPELVEKEALTCWVVINISERRGILGEPQLLVSQVRINLAYRAQQFVNHFQLGEVGLLVVDQLVLADA